MADKILATMGTTLESIKAGIGFQPSSRSTASSSTDVIYVPIDMKTIAQIQQLIDSDEPDIATVNLIKDAESLSSGVKLFFAGEELDGGDERRRDVETPGRGTEVERDVGADQMRPVG